MLAFSELAIGKGVAYPVSHVPTDDAEAAVVHDPLRITEKSGPSLAFDDGPELFALRVGNRFEESAAEHVHPVAEATFSIFQRCRAIEEGCVGDLEPVMFK